VLSQGIIASEPKGRERSVQIQGPEGPCSLPVIGPTEAVPLLQSCLKGGFGSLKAPAPSAGAEVTA
jgi:hypothetical protein